MSRPLISKPCRATPTITLKHSRYWKLYARCVKNPDTNNQTWDILLDREPLLRPLFEIADGLKPRGALNALRDARVCWKCGARLSLTSVCNTCLKSKAGKNLRKAVKLWSRSVSMRSRTAEQKASHLYKMKETCLERYGVENPYQSEDIKARIKEVHLQRLGVEYPAQSKSVIKKARKTLLKNHPDGVASENIQDKRRATSLQRFGVSHPMKTSLIKDKVRKTCLERFGVSSPAKAVSVLKKMSATCNRIYGVSNPLLDPKVQAKRRSTLQRNHGVDTPWKSPEVVAKSQATSMNRYGVRHYMQDPTHFAENLKKKFQRKKVEINGKSHIVQGYEAEVLKRLESKIDRLVTDPTGIPRIDWTDAEGKTHWYFPDAMVQTKDNRKLLLEVKSEYTVLGDAVRLKAKAAWSFCSKLPTLKYVIAVHAPAKGILWITNLRDLAALQSDLRN